jgi:hypothetical protein
VAEAGKEEVPLAVEAEVLQRPNRAPRRLPLLQAAEEAAEEAVTEVPSLRPLRMVTVAVAAIRRPLQLPDWLPNHLAEGAVGVVLLRHSPAAAMVVVAEDRQVRQHPLPHR